MNDFVNSCAGFVVYNKNVLFIMAKMEVIPRRLMLEDEVYRQIFDAEVTLSFQLFLDLLSYQLFVQNVIRARRIPVDFNST